MKPILFYEYETKNFDDLNIKDYQKKFLKSLSDSLVPNKSIFTYSSNTISATSIVGMISFDNVQIEILPKLLRRRGEVDGNCIIKNLMFMLSYTNQLEISDSSISSMASSLASLDHSSFLHLFFGSGLCLDWLTQYRRCHQYIFIVCWYYSRTSALIV